MPRPKKTDTTDLEQELNDIPADNETLHIEAAADNPFAKKHYQEWRVELKNGEVEKLKVIRERVMITDAMAETLNEGVREGKLNQFATMYYPAP